MGLRTGGGSAMGRLCPNMFRIAFAKGYHRTPPSRTRPPTCLQYAHMPPHRPSQALCPCVTLQVINQLAQSDASLVYIRVRGGQIALRHSRQSDFSLERTQPSTNSEELLQDACLVVLWCMYVCQWCMSCIYVCMMYDVCSMSRDVCMYVLRHSALQPRVLCHEPLPPIARHRFHIWGRQPVLAPPAHLAHRVHPQHFLTSTGVTYGESQSHTMQ
eukprot:COSAG01_NODE_11865_length_1845_cov_1.704467_2_plen_215_part_00